MRVILPGKLKLITQGANAFRSRMTGFDGAKVFVDLFLVLCLAMLSDEDLQSYIFMIDKIPTEPGGRNRPVAQLSQHLVLGPKYLANSDRVKRFRIVS